MAENVAKDQQLQTQIHLSASCQRPALKMTLNHKHQWSLSKAFLRGWTAVKKSESKGPELYRV